MGFEIVKTFRFDAAHHLPGLPSGHRCGRVHGHTWHVRLTLAAGELRSPGFVTDFGDLKPFADYLADQFDHRDLNEVVPFAPTSEAIARHFAAWFIQHLEPDVGGRLVRVGVSETPTSWAEYIREES
jgi:6-pyruvoyltetrahydropterin/6-carboxytetrahydropterin synthase